MLGHDGNLLCKDYILLFFGFSNRSIFRVLSSGMYLATLVKCIAENGSKAIHALF